MKPIRYDHDNVPLFCSSQVDLYGFPEHYGYEVYRIIESREAVFLTDYKFDLERTLKPIHRYDRQARFKTTLLNLLGERCNVPNHVFSMVKAYLKPDSKNLWDDTRAILKHFKQRKYYDCIPAIIKKILSKRLFEPITCEKLESIMNDYKALVVRYEQQKHLFKRKYFPNIRFIVLKLLELHSIKPLYPIPFVRTSRKDKILNSLWTSLLSK